MSKKSSILLYITAALILSCGFIITAGSFILKDLKYYAENTFNLIEQKTGYIITIDDIDLTIIKGAVVKINRLSIIEPEKKLKLLTCKNVQLQIRLLPLFKKELVVSRLVLNEPEFSISGIKDGDWTKVSLLPFTLNFEATGKNFFRFIFDPHKIILGNGRLLYKNSINNVFTSLDEIDAEISEVKDKPEYILIAAAKHIQDSSSGNISINSSFSLTKANINPENIYAQGVIKLSSIPASGFIPDIKNLINQDYHGALLNGDIYFTLIPGLKFDASGQIYPVYPNISFKNKSIIKFKSRGSKDRIFIDELDFILPDTLKLSGSASLLKLTSKIPEFNISLSKGSADITFLKNILNSPALPESLSLLLDKFKSGKAQFTDIHIKNKVKQDESGVPFSITGSCKLIDCKVDIYKDIPLINISDSHFLFTDKSLTGIASISAFNNDNSTIDIKIKDPFNKPAVELKINSRHPVKDISALFKKDNADTPSQNFFQSTSGIVTAVTTIKYFNKIDLSSKIDLSLSEYNINNKLIKPKNLNNTLYLKSEIDSKINIIDYNFVIENSFELNGSIKSLKPLSLNGDYKLNNFEVSSLILPLIPDTLSLSGNISGKGTYRFPKQKKTVLPFTGNLQIKNLTLKDNINSDKLITIKASSDITDKNINLKTSRVRVGASDLNAHGILDSALPPKGNISFNPDFLDIDDFIGVIITIIKRIPKTKPAEDIREPNPFSKTALNIDLRVKKGNFLKWDFDNATSAFTYFGSTLTWDDIILYTDNGTAQGRVVYDYTNPGRYRLELYPSKTDLDFTTLIPMFRKDNKITGRTDLTGSFTSTYNKGAEIIPNMNGLFSIQVKDGVIRRSKIISKSIDKMSRTEKISPDVPEIIYKSLPFDSLEADLSMDKNVIKTDDLILKSPAINLTAIGSVNLSKGELDFIVGTQVLKTIGKILGNIPIAGDLFTIDNKALTLGYFHVKGSFTNPKISALPFKSLGLGIKRFFMSILDIPMIFIPDNLFDNTDKEKKLSNP